MQAPPQPAPAEATAHRPVTRRRVLDGAGQAALSLSLARSARAAPAIRPEAALILLADLHSPYRRLARLAQATRDLIASIEAPCAILINGDLFERGNVAALRSDGAPDWALLEALAAIAPVVINLGNHETALVDDMAAFVARAREVGARPIGSIVDRRTGGFFAPPALRLDLGGVSVGLLGVATANAAVYREGPRAAMAFPDPTRFVGAEAARAFDGVDHAVVVSHAGIATDRAILPSTPTGGLLFGGHDHLTLDLAVDAARYAHVGAWGSAVGVVTLAAGAPPAVAVLAVGDDWAEDEALAALTRRTLDAQLTAADRAIVADLPHGLDIEAGALFAGEAVRRAAGADLALLGHTGFGAALAAGPLTRFDFDAWLRFDSAVLTTDVDGEALAAALDRCNQHRAPLDRRTGDFLYAPHLAPEPGRTYRLAVADWTAAHARAYLGRDDFVFRPAPGVRVKPVVEAALRELGR
jgi:2',3'-cyclic-nucleotide 2'-phosphodiesterase (5'-nucleotidase family)